ncbi:MAG TPA: multidrug efflux SMR transporter [Stackebrandtia sp.]|jgi:small multidrug resistance pump|uniref:DMT family transporter n=1 Tax=Stackebrandtia sp. TaxID=2023065 RepID=UPI002D293F1F|nr:multidrug efflux SMR transporter [Stackebrandtia sp.]HZE37943.1 multidrug efflux SMR transporter [Stackebrandtia sp.]
MSWVMLAGAIVAEVLGTVSLKISDGFSRVIPSILVVIGYAAAFVLLSMALKRGIPLGIAYGVWAAVGVALVALIGAVVFKEGLTWTQVGGLVLVAAGVAALEMGAAH